MAYEQRMSSGNLFRNRDKAKNPKAPDLKLIDPIQVQVGDQIAELDIAGWRRTSEKAGEFISLSVKVKHVRAESGRR